LKKKPNYTVSYKIGYLEDEVDCPLKNNFYLGKSETTKIEIFIEWNEFKNYYNNRILFCTDNSNICKNSKTLEFIDNELETNNNFDFLEFVNENEENSTDFPELLNGHFEDLFIDFIEEEKASVIDLESNQKVESVKWIMEGFTCGPLCGSGTIKYQLPNGKVFYISSWIS